MNPAIKLLLVIAIALEISFVVNIGLNLIIIGACLAYLIFKKVNLRTIAIFSLIAFLPAVGIFFSQIYYGSNGLVMGTALFTRLYAYIFLGISFSQTTYMIDLAQALEQNAHIPTKFIYGVLAAINLVPRLKYEIEVIRANGKMRGKILHPWMPTLYFKALIVAIGWSRNLAKAMVSQGFVEDQPRSIAKVSVISKLDWLLFLGTLLAIQVIIFIV
ncbi:energy-coupling factor transporter transmembrane component T [Fructilactobacillus vespulae]|uniref:energy-coupling factor transporter transmembrane component T family protein n=1 Tax=Fructilactobacillus vespulae TaxID=1249630 RepID=UPI0039B3A1F4